MTTRKIVLIVGAMVVAVGLIVVIFVGGIIGFALYTVGQSEAAMKAKEFLRTNATLKQDIGEVQDFGTFVTGSINIQNDIGDATLNLKVIGANKTVNASVHLAYFRGRDWRVSSASYINDRGEIVNLLDPYEAELMSDTLQFVVRCGGFNVECMDSHDKLKCIEHRCPHAV